MIVFTIIIAVIYAIFYFLNDLDFEIAYVFGFLAMLGMLVVIRKKLESHSELMLVVYICIGIIFVLNVQKDDVENQRTFAYLYVGYTYGCFTVLMHRYIINFSSLVWFYVVFLAARTAAFGV